MHHHCQRFSPISQLDLSSSVVRCSLYETRIDIWTIKNRKRAEFDHRYIFRKFWKYWIIYLLPYLLFWSFWIIWLLDNKRTGLLIIFGVQKKYIFSKESCSYFSRNGNPKKHFMIQEMYIQNPSIMELSYVLGKVY